MQKYIGMLFILFISLMQASGHEYQAADDECEDDFAALLCDVNHHAHDDMNTLERLKFLYSHHNIAHIKWAFYDKNKNAIIARYKRYNKNSEDQFVVLTKYLENNDITIRSTKKVLNNAGEAQVITCEADPRIISELKRDITLFEVRFDNHKNRHYYCWQESSDSE